MSEQYGNTGYGIYDKTIGIGLCILDLNIDRIRLSD